PPGPLSQALTSSHASCPAAHWPSGGTGIPVSSVTDQVPGSPSGKDRSWQLGQQSPSCRTSQRPLSTRYASGESSSPSMCTRTGSGSQPGSCTSQMLVHEHGWLAQPQRTFVHTPSERTGTHELPAQPPVLGADRKSTRLNSSHVKISYAV